MPGGDLFSYLVSQGGYLREIDARFIVYQVVVGLAYLHKNNIIHGHLKLKNILLASRSSGCRIVLTDFGAAKRIQEGARYTESPVDTVKYAAS